GSSTHTGTVRRNGSRWPSSRRIAGRTNSSNVTIVLTGLPGNPIHGVRSSRPKPSGAPGRMRMRHNFMSQPSSASTSRTKSCSPTLTPAVVTSRSASRAPGPPRCWRRLSFVSRANPRSTRIPPERRAGGKRDLALTDILAPVAHVLARIASCDHADAVRGGVLGVLLAHHRVGAGRERSTCEDPGRLTRPDRPRGELPGGDALDHREHDLTLGARPRHVAAASGVAVHG